VRFGGDNTDRQVLDQERGARHFPNPLMFWMIMSASCFAVTRPLAMAKFQVPRDTTENSPKYSSKNHEAVRIVSPIIDQAANARRTAADYNCSPLVVGARPS
jgi:hypothetical protein